VLAAGCAAPVFLCRPASAARESSAAPLRLLARTGADWTLLVDVLKRKGPPLESTLCLPSVPGGLQAILTPRLYKPSALLAQPVALPVTVSSTEADHALVSAPAPDARRHRLAH
jgi:protein ImuA